MYARKRTLQLLYINTRLTRKKWFFKPVIWMKDSTKLYILFFLYIIKEEYFSDFFSIFDIFSLQVACWENYSVFSISAFQYTILAYAFSKSVPYRKWVLSNYQLMASFIMLTAFTIYLVMAPARYTVWHWYNLLKTFKIFLKSQGNHIQIILLSRVFQQQFELLIPPVLEFRYMLLGFAALNICVCVILEDFVVEILLQKLVHR